MKLAMRVVTAIHKSANFALLHNRIWERNLLGSLKRMGIEVLPFEIEPFLREGDPSAALKEGVEPGEVSQRLVDFVGKVCSDGPVDLLFLYWYARWFEPSVLDDIRKTGIPVAAFYCNSLNSFHGIAPIAPHCDLVWVAEKQCLGKYRQIGANPLHLPMAADPEFYHPVPVERTIEVLFAGQPYADRAKFIGTLGQAGIGVRVCGHGWHQLTAPRRLRTTLGDIVKRRPTRRFWQRCVEPDALTDEQMVARFNESHLVLGFNKVLVREEGTYHRMVRLREFEVPMSGALSLTEYQDELPELFEPDREVVTFRDETELVDKARHYLKHPHKADAIRHAGHRRALSCHTWEHRFRRLFREMGLEQRRTENTVA